MALRKALPSLLFALFIFQVVVLFSPYYVVLRSTQNTVELAAEKRCKIFRPFCVSSVSSSDARVCRRRTQAPGGPLFPTKAQHVLLIAKPKLLVGHGSLEQAEHCNF